MHTPSRGTAWGVFLIALATLLFEVALTRIFAVTLWYHFGFLAISLALVGSQRRLHLQREQSLYPGSNRRLPGAPQRGRGALDHPILQT